MENKLTEVVKFLQSKQAVLTVAEINQICAILQEQIAQTTPKNAPKESKKE